MRQFKVPVSGSKFDSTEQLLTDIRELLWLVLQASENFEMLQGRALSTGEPYPVTEFCDRRMILVERP